MNSARIIPLYLLTAGVFFAIDLVWLGLVAPGFYRQHIGHLLAAEPRWVPAIAFYLVYIGGILLFAVLPALRAESGKRALGLGAALGFLAYATFDLTCLALFRDFPVTVVLVDLVWGSCLTAAVSAAGYGIGRRIGVRPAPAQP